MRGGAVLSICLMMTVMSGVSAAEARPVAQRVIDYGGFRVHVPGGWQVVDLAEEPNRCIRFDQNAIYLGLPRGEQHCPTRIVGRTEALHLMPMPYVPSRERRAGRRMLTTLRVPESVAHEIELAMPEAGVRVMGTYGRNRALLESVLRQGSVGAGRPPAAPPSPVEPPKTQKKRRAWTTGPGFDACAAPSLAAMTAWRPDYGVANIYIGGAARGCAQPNLTPEWIRAVRQQGYRLIPTYVGLQAPCTRFRSRFKIDEAAEQGRKAATDAVARAKALGIGKKKPIYFDMENYKSKNIACRDAVMTFLHSWTKRLHRLKYRSGVYSSASSGIRDLGRATGIQKPDSVWFAHWDGKAETHGSPYLLDEWWGTHRRIKQFKGGHYETHGGVKLHVDSNIVDGLVH